MKAERSPVAPSVGTESPRGLGVDAEELAFRYEEAGFELSALSLTIEPGERVALVGPSGSGKTTFLHLVAGILSPSAGHLAVGGVEWSGRSESERRRFRASSVGLVFQDFELLDHLTVRENVLLPFLVNDALRLSVEVEERLAALLRSAGVDEYLLRKPRALSQGERQRVAVCRALIADPPLVLADEPTANLDPDSGRRIVAALAEQAETRGATLVVVTHDRELLPSFDRVIDFGRLQGTGA